MSELIAGGSRTGSPGGWRTLLPQPLNWLARLFYYLNQPTAPFSTFADLDLHGPVDVDLLVRETLPLALERHPLLTCRVENRRWSGPWWVPAETPPAIDVAKEETPILFPGQEWLDLDHEPGLRIWLRTRPDGARLMVQVHHSCADGHGKLTFLAEWLALYAQRRGRGCLPPPLPPADYRLLTLRNKVLPAEMPFPLRDRLVCTWRILRLLFQPPEPLDGAPPLPPPRVDRPAPVDVCSFEPEEFETLRQTAQHLGVTLNDYLLGTLFLSMVEWKRAHGGLSPMAVLRQMVPYELRDEDQFRTSATNRVDIWFLSRRVRELQDVAALMQSIHREMEGPRRRARELLGALGTMDLLPGLLRFWTRQRGLTATAMLTNVGNLSRTFASILPPVEGRWHPGDLVVQSLKSYLSNTPQISLTMEALGYANQLHLLVLRDGRGVAGEQAAEFLQHFRERLLSGEAAGGAAEYAPLSAAQPLIARR